MSFVHDSLKLAPFGIWDVPFAAPTKSPSPIAADPGNQGLGQAGVQILQFAIEGRITQSFLRPAGINAAIPFFDPLTQWLEIELLESALRFDLAALVRNEQLPLD